MDSKEDKIHQQKLILPGKSVKLNNPSSFLTTESDQ